MVAITVARGKFKGALRVLIYTILFLGSSLLKLTTTTVGNRYPCVWEDRLGLGLLTGGGKVFSGHPPRGPVHTPLQIPWS